MLPGSDLFFDDSLTLLERWYCRIFGVPIIGLRIRLRRIQKLLPEHATTILDAGCGRGVISRYLARRYPEAQIEAIDENETIQAINHNIALKYQLQNCHFKTLSLENFDEHSHYDLIISVDNLEHIKDDVAILAKLYNALRSGGVLIVHVPHYYRRWPLFKLTVNFDVPGHVRPGYHLAELTERVRKVGFDIQQLGFSYGFLENLINNISYRITDAEEKNKYLYALLFPFLNVIAWTGKWSHPEMGAGVWLIAKK